MISIRHLKKEFENVTPLKDINAEIREGEVISIIGPSGTGKSTLLRCLNLLETPTSGEIFFNGKNILDGVDLTELRRRVGMVFQAFDLFPHLTAVENVMIAPIELLGMGRQEAYDEAMRLLGMVGLAEKALDYPDGLSGGQKQRVAIARALAMKPEVVLFDEPTSALDPTMVGEVLRVIRNLAKEGLTMIIVTHEMKFARDVSTRVFYMDDGEIYEEGTPEQIFDAPVRDKTRRFIRRLKTYERHISSRRFDFIQVSEEIAAFAQRQMLLPKTANELQLLFEELVSSSILPKLGDDVSLDFSIESAEASQSVEVLVSWRGESLDVLEDEDDLSAMIIRRITQKRQHCWENGVNTLTLMLRGID